MKKKYRIYCLLSFLILITIFLESCAQTVPDPVLLKQIAKIKAIDNHSHFLPATADQGTEEEPNDLLGQPPFDLPVSLRVDNPHWIGAWRDLYGYKYNDMKKEHLSLLFKEKQRIKRQQGENYPTWVLDKLGIETALVNSQELGLGQTPPRFFWVKYVDDFLNPFSSFYSYRQNNQSDIKPAATLAEYTKTVVTPAIESFKQEGAIAIKFGIAYKRPLNFEKVSSVEAALVYEQLLQEKEVSISEQRKLQDYLFRYITQEAGRLDLKVHIHTGVGYGTHFNISGSNPMLLESVFNDPDQRNTKFVMIHGGWPFDKEAGAMLIKPNVYVDFSAQTFLRPTHALSKTIRAWLDWYPEKVLFGTDATGEDSAWLSTNSARNALAIALTEMMNDGQISRNRAVELAEMVLRTNAIRLYDLKTKLLVEKGADISLHTAARQGLQEQLKKLIEKGADVNAKDSSGHTPLHYAAREGYKEIIELLLENGADVNIRVKYYNLTTAEIAMNNNHNNVVELLVSKGADISPLHLALYMKDEARAKSLIEGGADVNERTPYGNTPMHRAVNAGLKDIVELLIAKGADVNARDKWDWTRLHSAAEEGHRELAELLIAKGANVNARDPLDRTPLWYAQYEGHTKIVELLRKHGAKE